MKTFPPYTTSALPGISLFFLWNSFTSSSTLSKRSGGSQVLSSSEQHFHSTKYLRHVSVYCVHKASSVWYKWLPRFDQFSLPRTLNHYRCLQPRQVVVLFHFGRKCDRVLIMIHGRQGVFSTAERLLVWNYSSSAKIIPCVLCVLCVWRTRRLKANRESGRDVDPTLHSDFELLSALRSDAIPTQTPTSCVSWLRLVHCLCVLTSPDLGLFSADTFGTRTLPPWWEVLLTEPQGFVHLPTSHPDVFCTHLPPPGPTMLISPVLTSRHFFLISPPIYAASWSNGDSIRRRRVIWDTWWTNSDTLSYTYRLLLFLTLSWWVLPYPDSQDAPVIRGFH